MTPPILLRRATTILQHSLAWRINRSGKMFACELWLLSYHQFCSFYGVPSEVTRVDIVDDRFVFWTSHPIHNTSPYVVTGAGLYDHVESLIGNVHKKGASNVSS